MQGDSNSYTSGRIHEYNVVIASLTRGRYGTIFAAVVAECMQRGFPAHPIWSDGGHCRRYFEP